MHVNEPMNIRIRGIETEVSIYLYARRILSFTRNIV